jgi:biotin carboxyl carrier protein
VNPHGELAVFLGDGLPAILEVLQGTDVSELILQEGDLSVRVQRILSSNGSPEVGGRNLDKEFTTVEPVFNEIVAPLVGTFYRAGKPGMPPLVAEGTRVAEDTIVGIVEALHVLTEVPANCSGTVVSVLATDGMPVQYGQPLFLVSPGG